MFGNSIAFFRRQPSKLRETDSADLHRDRNQIAKRFGLAFPQSEASLTIHSAASMPFMAVPPFISGFVVCLSANLLPENELRRTAGLAAPVSETWEKSDPSPH